MLVVELLAEQLNALSKRELSSEDANQEFATIITDFIKTATVTVDVTGIGNMGAPVQSTGTGQIS